MIRTKIYVERNNVDLYDDVAAEYTYAIDDIKDFASRNTSFSKTIVVPGTANNNKLFGHVFEFASSNPYDPAKDNVNTNFNAAVAADCIILVDNIQIFKGVLRLLQINIDRGTIEYECAVFGELGGFANAIGNKKIEELDFSAYDHAWTFANITASWENINGQGYYYPLIDYGKVSTNKKDWQYKALRPAYYVKEILHKIITNAGYTYESNFFNTGIMQRLIIPQNLKEMRRLSTSALTAELDPRTYPPAGTGRVYFIPGTLGDFTYNATARSFTYTNATPLTTDLTFNFTGDIPSPAVGNFQLNVFIVKNTSAIGSQTIDLPVLPTSFNGEIILQNVVFNQNDVLFITMEVTGNFSFDILYGDLLLKSNNPQQLIAVNYGETIEMNQYIPKGVFQRDFVTSIVKMFNLYIYEDVNKEKHLKIEPGLQYYDRGDDVVLAINDFGELLIVENTDINLLIEPGESAFLDWSTKVDRAKPMTLKPMSELNGRYFEYKYKSDNDYYNEQYQKKYSEGYADRVVDTGYVFANEKQTAEVIFSATPLVGYQSEAKVYPTIVKLSNVGTPQQVEDLTEHNIRILQARKISGVPAWNVLDGTTIRGTGTSYGFAGHIDSPVAPTSDINFGSPKELYFELPGGVSYPTANLYSGFWGDYISEITNKDSKLLTCFVKLTEQDIFNLNFARLIYIDGALWRLNKVVDFNTQDTTKCEFLRVLETSYE